MNTNQGGNVSDLRRKRLRDRLAECPVFVLDDGRRALQLWPDYAPPPVPLPNTVLWQGRWYYVLTQELLASLVTEAIADPVAGERRVALLKRMCTAEEWAQAEEIGRLVAQARPVA